MPRCLLSYWITHHDNIEAIHAVFGNFVKPVNFCNIILQTLERICHKFVASSAHVSHLGKKSEVSESRRHVGNQQRWVKAKERSKRNKNGGDYYHGDADGSNREKKSCLHDSLNFYFYSESGLMYLSCIVWLSVCLSTTLVEFIQRTWNLCARRKKFEDVQNVLKKKFLIKNNINFIIQIIVFWNEF